MKRSLSCLVGLLLVAGLWHQIGFAQSGPKNHSIEVPFEFYRNSVVLQVRVNGKGPYNMLLDTGTDPSVISWDTAKEIGLKVETADVGGSGTGSDKIVSYKTVLPDVQIGNLAAKDIAALAGHGLAGISKQLGMTISGVLGYSFLKDRIVQFDYPKRVIRFYSASPFSKHPKRAVHRVVLPFQLFEGTPLIDEVYINGKRIRTTLDTGSNGTLRLTATAIKALGLEAEAERATPMSVTGYAGKAQFRKGRVKSLAVAGLVVDASTITFKMEKQEGEEREPEGNIGNVFMSNFSVTFDYRRKTVVFEKN